MSSYKPELKAECIRLRVQDRKSLGEIQALTGASKGSLSAWLKPYPLRADELEARSRDRVRYIPPKKDRGEQSPLFLLAQAQSLSSNQKAKIAEAAVLFRLCLHGHAVYGSPFDGDKVDWIVDTGKRVLRLQVKLALQTARGLPTVSLCCGNGRNKLRPYREGEFDFVVGYDLYSDTAYVWSWAEVGGHKQHVSVTSDAAERWDKLGM